MLTFVNNLLGKLTRQEDGNSATEYAIMIALILVFCIAALLSTGDIQQAIWFNSATKVESIVPK
jgi:Flp pilus assembly pilin Flp